MTHESAAPQFDQQHYQTMYLMGIGGAAFSVWLVAGTLASPDRLWPAVAALVCGLSMIGVWLWCVMAAARGHDPRVWLLVPPALGLAALTGPAWMAMVVSAVTISPQWEQIVVVATIGFGALLPVGFAWCLAVAIGMRHSAAEATA